MKEIYQRGNIVRIKDIAEKAKVSTGTVDRVLHNRGRVSDEVKQRVLAITKELDYEPNLLARVLVSKRNITIAALVPDPSFDTYWEAPYEGIDKAAKELRQFGMTVTFHLFNQFSSDSFRKAAEEVSSHGYDGILVAPLFYRESLTYLSSWKRQGIPFNLFNTHIPDYEPLAYIGQDSYQSGVLAAKLLHYGQHLPGTLIIVHVDEDVQNSTHLIKKEQGFRDYFSQLSGNEFTIAHVELVGSSDTASFSHQLDKLFEGHPETKGLFVTTSKAYTIASYLESKKRDDIHLIGYDLLQKNLQFLEKGIINFLINQNPRGQGYFGIQLLADHLIYKKKVNPIKYLPLDIITKENLHYYIGAE